MILEPISDYYVGVIRAFQDMQECLMNLNEAVLKETHLPAWMDSSVVIPDINRLTHRERACEIINMLEYHDAQAPREIIVCAGYIGASPKTIEMALQLNRAKDHFKKVIIELKKAKIKFTDNRLMHAFEETLTKRPSNTSDALKRFGLQRLHLKQCYRRLPILKESPINISWTWANTRSIRKISKIEAMSLLEKKGKDSGIVHQIYKLNSIHNHEPLAIIQELAPHLRTNILFSDNQRLMVKGPVPIFYPAEKGMPEPKFKPPSIKKLKNKNRVIRADLQIDPEPFLPAIHVHRYLAYSQK